MIVGLAQQSVRAASIAERRIQMQAQQLYQGRCALHALASGAWQRAGIGWCVLQLMQVQPGRYQLIGRDSANTQQVSGTIDFFLCGGAALQTYRLPPAQVLLNMLIHAKCALTKVQDSFYYLQDQVRCIHS